MPWIVRTNVEATDELKKTIEAHNRDIFELDIKPEAVRESPVDRGTNRRSIDVDSQPGLFGTVWRIFTQSGYGGFLELGTRYLSARPYIYPAFQKFKKKLTEGIKVPPGKK